MSALAIFKPTQSSNRHANFGAGIAVSRTAMHLPSKGYNVRMKLVLATRGLLHGILSLFKCAPCPWYLLLDYSAPSNTKGPC